MLNFLVGIANTGDTANPWLIAICMIVSIVVVITLFIISRPKNKEEDEEDVE